MARKGGGSIVCILSTAAQMAFRWLSSYGTAKAALESLVRCAAEELASAGIRVNAVRPGLFHSEANLVLFLASDESRFINGAELRIDNTQLISGIAGSQ